MFNLNPMYHLIKLFRLPLYDGMTPSPVRIGSALAVSLAVFLVGWFVFTRKAQDFSYHV